MGNYLLVYVIPQLSGQVCWYHATDSNDAFTCNIWIKENLCYMSMPLYVHYIFFITCNMKEICLTIVLLITVIDYMKSVDSGLYTLLSWQIIYKRVVLLFGNLVLNITMLTLDHANVHVDLPLLFACICIMLTQMDVWS